MPFEKKCIYISGKQAQVGNTRTNSLEHTRDQHWILPMQDADFCKSYPFLFIYDFMILLPLTDAVC